MSLRWMVPGFVTAVLTLVAGCSMPWDSDCTVGECGPERGVAEELADDADVEIEGEEELGELGDGESLVAVGEVTDEYAEVTFEAEAGEWYDISVYSRGLPTPSFEVDAFAYERWSPYHQSGLGERPIVPFDDSEHTIRIYSEYFEEQSADPPASPEDEFWEFVLEIEHRDAPEPTTIEDGEEVTVDPTELREHLYVIEEPDETSAFRVHRGLMSSMYDGLIRYEEDLGWIRESFVDLVAGPDVEDAVFWADYVDAPSSNSSYEISVDSRSGIGPGQIDEQQRELDAGEALIVDGLSDDSDLRVDVEIERDGEVVAGGDEPFNSWNELADLGALYVADEAGEVTVRIENDNLTTAESSAYEIRKETPEYLGSFGSTGDVEVEGGGAIDDTNYGLYELELTEDAIGEFRLGDESGSDLYVIERSLFQEQRIGPGYQAPMEAGTYRIVVGESVQSDSIEDFEIELAEPAEPAEATYDLDLGEGDILSVRNPYNNHLDFEVDMDIEVAMSVDCPGEEPLEVQDLGEERSQFVAFPGAGDCDIHLETSVWYEELDEEPSVNVVEGEDRGQLEVGGGAVESTIENDEPTSNPFVFELDEPAWVTWRLEEGEDYELGIDIDETMLEGFEVLEPVERRRMVGRFEAGSHAVLVEFSDQEVTGETMLLEAEPTADVGETDAPNLAVPLEDEGPAVAEMEVDDCGSATRVAVDLDIESSTDPEARIELAGPSGETARLVDEDHLWPLDIEASKTFPDGVEPEESMASLGEAGADGTWEIELVEVGPFESEMILEEWSLYLWCDG